jgi:two-component system, chemotaxis family, CheB/CheR fusion protein
LVGLRPYRTTDERVNGIVLTFLDVTSLVRAEEHQRALVAELNHRVKNMLTVVLSLVVQILAKNKNPELFAEAFIDRLHALARTYELLSNENWSEVSLRTVVQQELRPFAEKRISIEGPGVMLQPKPALSFGMVLHELVTNAVKYGALAGEEGQVKVRWNVSDGHLLMDWRETGGPAVKRPEHRGFGSELIEQEVSYGLDGHLKFKFDKGGLKVDIDIPVESGIRFTGVSV